MSEDVDESGDAETSSAAVRYRWTNDLLAGALIVAQVLLLSVSLFTGVSLPSMVWEAFVVEALLAATWAFGRGAAGELLENLSGGKP